MSFTHRTFSTATTSSRVSGKFLAQFEATIHCSVHQPQGKSHRYWKGDNPWE